MALFPAKPHGWTKTVESHVIYNFFIPSYSVIHTRINSVINH